MSAAIEKWLKAYIREQVQDEDCVDNLRWANIEDKEQMKRYEEAILRGCCGFFDSEVKAPDGRVYVVGCNYGH